MQQKYRETLEKRHLPLEIFDGKGFKKKEKSLECCGKIIETLLKKETIENQGWCRRSKLVKEIKMHPVTIERMLKKLLDEKILERHDVIVSYSRSNLGKTKIDVYYRVSLAIGLMDKMSKAELIEKYQELIESFGEVANRLFAAKVLLTTNGVKDPNTAIKQLLDGGLFRPPTYQIKKTNAPPFIEIIFSPGLPIAEASPQDPCTHQMHE
jgi:DNA-binding Lrp family transcriptional regulator